jgi:lysozyme
MKVSDKGIALIKKFEGCSLTAYKCSAGCPTIGMGHTKGVRMGDKITQKQADQYLREDLKHVELGISSLNLNLPQGQFDACCSLAFNIGLNAFFNSDLLQCLKDKAYHGAALHFTDWVYVGRKINKGLLKRRKEERALFLDSCE